MLILSTWSAYLFAQCPGKTIILDASFTDSCGSGAPINVTLTNNSTGGPFSGLFELFQDGNSIGNPGGGSSVVATIAAAGKDTFMLTYDQGSCQDTDWVIVTYATGSVNADFTMSQTTICAGQNIALTNTSTGAISSYNWTFGNGNTSASVGPHTQTYLTPGSINIQLSVTGACGTDTEIKMLTVIAGTSVAFTTTNDSFCVANTVVFTNTSTATGPYTWSFGDGGSSGATSPNHAYTSAGTYQVILSTTAPGTCTDSVTANFVIVDTIHVNISGNDGDGDTRNCLAYNSGVTTNTVNFSNSSTGATSYTWNFGDGSLVLTTLLPAPVSHTYNSYGVFNVIMTAYNGVCNESDTIKVIFGRNPKADFSVPPPTAGCAPLIISPTNLSQNGQTYIWDFGDLHIDTISTYPAPTNTYLGGGYAIYLTVINFCDTDQTFYSPIIVAPLPEASFNSSLTNGCVPQAVSFTNTTINFSPSNNFQWYFGDGTSQLNVPFNNPVNHTYTYSDTFTVTLIAGNVCGKDTFTHDIIILDKPHASFSVTPNSGCLPSSLNISNLTSGQISGYQWFVNGIQISTDTIPTSSFLSSGILTYVIKLVASNSCGTDDTTITVTFGAPTLADFTISDNTLCVGDNTVLTNTSSGSALSYQWNFGNGNTSTLAGPHTQTYPSAGLQTVTLIANGACGADTVSKTIDVYSYPTSSFTPSDNNICKGENITFNNTSTLGSTASWTFQNGSPSSSSTFNPSTVQFNLAGAQTVTLNTTMNGCTSSSNSVITVNALPVPNFAITPSSGCTPLNAVFTNLTTNTPGNIYAWDLDQGITSTLYTAPSQTYINFSNLVDSTFTIKLLVTNTNGCRDSLTKNIDVRPAPSASFTQSLDTACALDPVQFTNASVGATSYNWNFDDGNTSTNTNPLHLFPSFGIYDVVLISTNSYGCKDTATQSTVVDSIPTVDFTFAQVCFGETTLFTNASSGGSIWDWQFGDGGIDSIFNTSHVYTTTGNFNVTLIGSNPGGCADTISKTIFISPIPVADFSFSHTCETQNTLFSDLSTSSPTSWSWDFGDASANSINQNTNHIYANSGNYTVVLIVENIYSCKDTAQKNVTIDSIPTTDFLFANACMHDSILFNNTTVFAADTFIWNFGDGTFSNTPSLNHAYATPGNYNVTLIAGYTQSLCFDTMLHSVSIYQRSIPDFTYISSCFGDSTPFNDNSSFSPITWTWNFGDGTILSGIQNPVHNYTSASGTYNVTLTTSTVNGCMDSVTKPVIVKPKPTAGFINDSACFGNAVTVQDTSQANIIDWHWDMGNFTQFGGTPTLNYTYTDTGLFTIELIVTNSSGCHDTALQNTYIYPIPNADFTFDTVCFAQSTSFMDASLNPTSWTWYFNDGSGSTSFSQNPNYVFASDGIFPIKLIVQNGFLCLDSTIKNVWVKQKPKSGFYLNSVCAFDTSSFIDTTLYNPISWSWDFGDGSSLSTSQNPSHIYNSGGNYNITLITSNAIGCFDTLVQPITAYTTPVANFSVDTACLNNITHFQNLSTDIYPIVWSEWDFGDGNNSYAFSPSYIYQDSGIYTVSLLLINDKGCDTTIQKQVLVKFTPDAQFTVDTVCVGLPTHFSSTSVGANGQWIWNFGDGIIDTVYVADTTHTYTSGGVYVVLLENAYQGCSDQAIGIVHVVSDAQAQIHFDSVGYCLGELIQFVDSSQIGSGILSSISWDFGDGSTSSLQNPTHLYSNTGSYQVMLAISTNIGCVDTTYATVPLFVNPVADFALNPNNVCQGQYIQFEDLSSIDAGSIINYQWIFGDGNFAYTQNAIHTYDNIGTYFSALVVYSDQGCTDTVNYSLNVLGGPTADFTYSSTCSNDTTTFTDLSSYTGTILNWNWNFGDANTSNDQNPIHWYNLYQDSVLATLVVTADNGCQDSVQHMIYFFAPPVLNFRAINAEGCAPFKASFEDNSYTNSVSSLTNWFWDFGDGTYSFEENPVHTYSSNGNYYVILTVTNSFGCSISDTMIYPVIVHPGPTPDFATNPPAEASILNPTIQIVDLVPDTTHFLMWIIDGIDSIGNDSSTQYTFADTGWHSITQWVANNYGCQNILTKDIYIRPEFTFYIPNTFSPNIDGNNEVFIGKGVGVRSVRMVIYDREGHIVFESYDKDTGWKGLDVAKNKIKIDTYVYQIYVTDIFGNEHYYMGSVNVVR